MLLHALSCALVSTSLAAPITDPGPGLTPAQQIHQLLPPGTFAYFELASLDDLERAVRDTLGVIAPSELEGFDVMKILSEEMELPGDLSGVLHDQPLGIAVAFPGDVPQPVPVFLVPFADPTTYAASFPEMPDMARPHVAGSYVALTMGPELGAPGAGTALTEGMAPGLLRGRVDLARLIEAYRPMIDMGMDMGRMQVENELDDPDLDMPFDLEAMIDAYFDIADDVLESAELLELTLQVNGTQVHWHEVFTAKTGSPLGSVKGRSKTPLAAMVGSTVPGAAVTWIGTADFAALTKQLMPFMRDMMGMYPDDLGKAYMDLLSAYEPIYPLLGDAVSGSGDFASDGMRVAYVYTGGEPQKAVDAMAKAISNPALAAIGIELSSEPTLREIGGGPVYEHDLRYDWDKMMSTMGSDPELQQATVALDALFGDTMRLAFAPRDERLVIVIGGDDAYLSSAVSAGQRQAGPSGSYAHSLEALGGANPAMAMQLDLGLLISQAVPDVLAAFGEELHGGMDPVSVPIGIHFGIEDSRIWRAGFNLDVLDVAKLVEVLEAME